MKAAICEWTLPKRGVPAIYQAKALGFSGIQITEMGGYEKGFPLNNPKVQETYRTAVSNTGVEIQALHLWSLCRVACMLHPLDSVPGKIALLSIRKGIEACETLHIPRLMLTSGLMCQTKNKKDYLLFGEYMKFACDLAEGTGVKIVFESAFSKEEIYALTQMTGGRLKVCYDLFNPVRFDMGDPVEDIRFLADKGCIDHFHVKDGPENCIGCLLLGTGIGHFQECIDEIRKTGYDGWLVTENYYVDMEESCGKGFEELAVIDRRTMEAI